MKDLRIGIVVLSSKIGKIQQNLEKIAVWTKKAKKERADLICFPEMNITGYSAGNYAMKTALCASCKTTDKIRQLAAEHSITILAGMAEKDKAGNFFVSHLVFAPDKSIEIYKKLHMSPPERDVFTEGSKIPLFEINGVKFGIQLCYDAHFPELSSNMAVRGAEVIFMPHASPRGTSKEKYKSWMRHLTARAYDNSIFLVACNQTGDNGSGLNFPGLSLVLGPSGNILCKDLSGMENMLMADLKAEDMLKVRGHRMRFFLPSRRSDDLYKI